MQLSGGVQTKCALARWNDSHLRIPKRHRILKVVGPASISLAALSFATAQSYDDLARLPNAYVVSTVLFLGKSDFNAGLATMQKILRVSSILTTLLFSNPVVGLGLLGWRRKRKAANT